MSADTNQYKILFLNLPHHTRVQRRYMCSYNTPSMLFPPIEMLYLASIAKVWHQSDVYLLDAIAENTSLDNVIQNIQKNKPDMVVCLTGFEIFEEDIKIIQKIKIEFNKIKLVLFGHYPTTFPSETLAISNADFVLQGEPDINFSHLLDYVSNKIDINELKGVYYLDSNRQLIINQGEGRIKKPNELPLPAHDLLKIDLYNEPFLPKPFGLIQSARGCPYACNFCVRSYGTRLALRSPESMVEEIKLLVDLHKIQSLRFIDDTFTATSKRVIKFCQLLIDSGIKIKWTCLSRADTLNEEMISWMKKSGCVRIYIGIESGSPKILKLIDKEIDLNIGLLNIQILKKYKIETSAFFMVGYPEESIEDFNMSMKYAKKANFDYIIPSKFTPYPGTTYYEQNKDKIEFSLFPYKNNFIDSTIDTIAENREKFFYKSFYFRFSYVLKVLKKLVTHPSETILNAIKALKFQVSTKDDTVRSDYI